MNDPAGTLARRLQRLDSHLSIVLSVHLFVEALLDRLLDARSPMAKRIRRDRRTYTFAVRLALVFHLGLLSEGLFENLLALNRLRNAYAHEIDVDLARALARGFVLPDGTDLFPDPVSLLRSVGEDPALGARALLRVRDVTFGWLHEVARREGIAA